MFSLLKTKKTHPSYESIAKDSFTENNLFVKSIYEFCNQSPGKKTLMKWCKKRIPITKINHCCPAFPMS